MSSFANEAVEVASAVTVDSKDVLAATVSSLNSKNVTFTHRT